MNRGLLCTFYCMLGTLKTKESLIEVPLSSCHYYIKIRIERSSKCETTSNDARSCLVIIDSSSAMNAAVIIASGKNRNSSPENERQVLLLCNLLILFTDNGILVYTMSINSDNLL